MKDQSKTKQAQSQSARRKPVQALKESRENGWTILENIQEGYYEVNLAGSYTFLNSSMSKITGYTEEEMMGMNYRQYVDKDNAKKIFLDFNEIYRTGIPSIIEYEQIKKDGSKVFVETSVALMRDSFGQPAGFRGIVRDIAAHKPSTEELLRESEEKFRYVFDRSIIGNSIIFPTGEMDANQAFCEMVGYSKEELCKMKWLDITHPEEIELSQMIVNSILSGEKDSARFNRRYIHKSGAIVWADVSTIIRRDKEGKPLYLMTAISDITERMKAEESLNRVNEELKIIDGMKSEFIAIASHELRTPLTSIKNTVDIILKGAPGTITDEQEKFLSMAQRNINRLNTLISDMLNISKIESGKMQYRYIRMDIREIIGNVMHTLHSLADKKSVAFNLDISPDLPVIYGDVSKIEEVLINLVGNAIKFTPEQGDVTINVRQRETAPDMPEEAMGYAEVSVADTGIGIPEEYKEHLFEKFYQASHHLARQDQSGTGLGLAIRKGIIEGHKGKIWFESTQNKGSTFHFSLPVYSPQVTEIIALEKMALVCPDSRSFSLLEVNLDQEVLTSMNMKGPDVVEKFHDQLLDIIREGLHRDSDHIIVNPISCGLLIMLDQTPKERAMIVRKKIEAAFSRRPISFEGMPLFVPTISDPVAFPEDGATMGELLAAMKQQGVDSSGNSTPNAS